MESSYEVKITDSHTSYAERPFSSNSIAYDVLKPNEPTRRDV